MTTIQVEIEVDEASTFVDAESIRTVERAIQTILGREGFGDHRHASVTVLLTGDARLRELNREFAGEDHATDVLSFAAEPSDGFPIVDQDPDDYLGDIAISIPQTERQARDKNQPFVRELSMLAIHGTLHILGYDHATADEERIMFGKTDEALDELFAG